MNPKAREEHGDGAPAGANETIPPRKRVLFLDLYARKESFVSNEAFAELGAKLNSTTIEVMCERLVLDDTLAGETFLSAVATLVRTLQPEVVVFARAWDRSLPRSVREALPEAKLVRLTHGVTAAIDDAFDHVLDPLGLMRLFAGDPSPTPATFEPVKAADLRRRAPLLNERIAASRLPPSGNTGRPTISGPSSGCPFLLDARTNPAFSTIALDPLRIQTKGCTYCLDNSGAYVVPKEGDVLSAWLSGLRLIRDTSKTKGRIEVLLTDERPHPFLPALFQALIQEEELGAFEILWKSRADWLIQYKSDIEKAAALAETSGSVLHLYLMGFESFYGPDLELFNKGYGPDVNEAAMEYMRALSDRFPRSFECKRYRSHGIVLFTPWTTPESLLENARSMRRLKFHELRSEAIKTRLRLYPRVPLYELALQQELLTETFQVGRGDRAIEQGYDASVPWKFADARVEAIFQLANALHATDRTLLDCDLIEIATQFVLRFPGIAKTPHLGHLPVRAAIEAWGAPLSFLLSVLGPGGATFDPEIEGILCTDKRAALKESVAGADAEDMAHAYAAMGFAARVVLRHGMKRSSGDHVEGKDHAVVCVARNEEALTQVIALQRQLAPGKTFPAEEAQKNATLHDPVSELGTLMGYPSCCVHAFTGLEDRGDNLENERAPFRRAPHEPLHPLLHRTGALRLLSHHLCSPSCNASIEVAKKLVSRLNEFDSDASTRLKSLLLTPSLFLDYDQFASIKGAWKEGVFELEGVVRTGRTQFEGALGRAHSLTLTPQSVVLHLKSGGEQTLRAMSPLMLVPGEALSPAAKHALGQSKQSGGRGAEKLRKSAVSTSAPPLPSAIKKGLRAAAYVIASIETTPIEHTVLLSGRGERVVVRLRSHTDGTPYTLRKGRWAVDVNAPETLTEPARAAISLLVRALG